MTTRVERYPAVVTANEDPEKRGRIRVKCAGIMGEDGDDAADVPGWVEPTLDWGMFAVPDVDEQVEVELNISDDTDEAFGQTVLEGGDLRWRGKRFYAPEADKPTVVHEEFSTNYGKRRGIATPMGHILFFDDTKGKTEITLGWVDADGVKSRLNVDKDGTVTLSALDAKHVIILSGKDKKVTVSLDEGDAVMTLEGAKLEVKLGGGATLQATDNEGDATLTVGDGAKHVAIVEELKTLYNDLKTELNTLKSDHGSHTHPFGPAPSTNVTAIGAPVTTTGNTSPPASPSTANFPSWNSAIESTKVAIPEG